MDIIFCKFESIEKGDKILVRALVFFLLSVGILKERMKVTVSETDLRPLVAVFLMCD